MAKQNSEYEEGRKKLAGLLKTEPIKTPIQEVRPIVEDRKSEPQAHLNFWVPDELMTRLKVHSAKTKKSIKQIGIEAIEAYLSESI